MGRRLLWTPEATALAVELGLQELGLAEIGRRVGASGRRVSKLFARLRRTDKETAPAARHGSSGRPRKPTWWDGEGRRETAFEMVAAGATMVAIAAKLGTSKNAVIGLFARVRIAQQAELEMLAGPEPPTLDDRLRWAVVMAPGCRWVFGNPVAWSGADWRWCGAEPLVAGSAYCRTHWQEARQ